jgi:hypothetical protein
MYAPPSASQPLLAEVLGANSGKDFAPDPPSPKQDGVSVDLNALVGGNSLTVRSLRWKCAQEWLSKDVGVF